MYDGERRMKRKKNRAILIFGIFVKTVSLSIFLKKLLNEKKYLYFYCCDLARL